MEKYTVKEIIANPDLVIEALIALRDERKKNKALTTENSVQKQQISEMLSRTSYYDAILNCKSVLPISAIAEDYGWKEKEINDFLCKKGVQVRQGNVWILCEPHVRQGYTMTRTHTYCDTVGNKYPIATVYWTQKGRLFLYHLLKQHGYLPLIEAV